MPRPTTRNLLSLTERKGTKKNFNGVAESYADVVTLIEGIFVAQSMGSKKYPYD